MSSHIQNDQCRLSYFKVRSLINDFFKDLLVRYLKILINFDIIKAVLLIYLSE